METDIRQLLDNKGDNYILPFLWMRGEEESVIRAEMEAIAGCGIGAVCLEARPHPDFAGPQWWHDVDVVLDEAKKRDMKIWILDDAHFPTGMANGLVASKYPERAKKYVNTKYFDIAGPCAYATLDVALSMTKRITWLDLGKPVEKSLMEENTLLSVMAYPVIHDDVIESEGLDLTEYVKEGILTYSFPAGLWRVFVSFTTYDGDSRPEYINIIDEESVQVLIEAVYEKHYEKYADEFGKTILGFFSDEPGMGNSSGFLMDDKIGRKEMPLPWNKDVPVMLEERLGSDWKKKLPFLWADTVDGIDCREARFVYMDIVTRLYEKNFAGQLGRWCAAHKVSYIGHVIEDNNEHCHLGCGSGHYFRAMAGQHMAGVDMIGGQVIPGMADINHKDVILCKGPFFHYTELKMGASAALFQKNKKGRLMCETYGAYGWGFGVKNMKWLTDHLIASGVNHLVPHAFSMAEYPDLDCPPHFNARGNNPELPYFGSLMRYANRLCHLFNGGKWIPDVAILYCGDLEWLDDCMYMEEPARELYRDQIDYCILPMDALTDLSAYHTECLEKAISVNGTRISTIIVPEANYVDERLVGFMREHPDVQVIFVNAMPKAVVDTKNLQDAEQTVLAQGKVVPLADLAAAVRQCGAASLKLEKDFPEMLCYHYRKDTDTLMLFNESMSETYEGMITLPFGGTVVIYDAMKNVVLQVPDQETDENGKTRVQMKLAPYESVVIVADASLIAGAMIPDCDSKAGDCEVVDLSESWTFGKARSIDYPNFGETEELDTLSPVSVKYPTFSGVMMYEKEIEVAEDSVGYLNIEQLFEVGRVLIDGEEVDRKICPPYHFSLGILPAGTHTLTVEVANTPARDVLGLPPGPFGYDRGFYEPSGMFGKIELILK